MKNKYLFIFLLPLFALLGYSGGALNGYTGSPGDGNNCTACHSFSGTAPTPTITLTGFPSNTYQPGQTYNLHLEVTGVNNPKTGFQLTIENSSNAKMGGLTPVDSNTQSGQGGNYITHTSSGNTSHAWDFQWTAPSNAQGNLGVYFAVNIANGDGTSSGDFITTNSINLQEDTSGIPEISNNSVRLFPNPAIDFITIQTDKPVSQINLLDINGKEVEVSIKENKIDVSLLPPGNYFIHIKSEGKNFVKQFIKK